MHCVKADRPGDWTEAHLYILADLHIGDPLSDTRMIARRIEDIASDPLGVVILNGDILNTALRNSVSDVYSEILPPMKQIEAACTLLKPIADKIIGATTGNHEARTYREDGIDMTRLIARQLGFEACYAPEGVLIFLRFGHTAMHGRHKDKPEKQLYTIYATHGTGGGKKEGAKAINLADLAGIVDADVYIRSHTHQPMHFTQGFHRTSPANSSVSVAERHFVSTGAALDYGGYSQSKEFKPGSKATPTIRLEAKKKNIIVSL